MFAICARKIDQARLFTLNDFPAKFEIVRRQPEFCSEDVHRADRQQSEFSLAAGQSVYHFVDCAVAAGGDDFFEAFQDGTACYSLGFTGVRSGANNGIARQRRNLATPSLSAFAVGSRIENDERVTHRRQNAALIFSSNMACVTSSGAKIQPGCALPPRGCVDRRRGPFAWRELVCAIARDTSEDSAGTPPASGHNAKYSTNQRDALGRP